jgi:hypothetical protein
MSLTGGISFFKRNKAIFEDGSTAVASSNSTSASLILGTNKFFKWESIGSDDTTTETITITMPDAVDITRIFLADHNWKEYTIKFGGVPTDFTTVVGIDGALGGGIAETAYARDTSYYEFDLVNTDTIEITVTKTQVADEEKSLVIFIVTEELGTLLGFPRNSGVNLNRNVRRERAISGRMHVEKSYESASMDLILKGYAVGTDTQGQADIDLLDSLHDRDIPFIVWPNGGVPTNFRFEQRGWRLKDIYQMQTDTPTRNAYRNNVYKFGVDQRYSFQEVV